MDAQWRIQLLGELRGVQGDRIVTRFRTQKTGALLAYLAYYRERAHPREVLIDLLWPEADPERARQSLSMALSSLRHQLEPPGAPAGTVLLADRLSLQMNPAAVTTDVAEFEAALQAAARVPGSAERLRHLEEAVERYRGELLPGYYEAWVLPEQQRLGELYFQAIREVIQQREAAGELEAAIRLAGRAVSADRLREEAHAELMRLYAAAGKPNAALRQYQELERLLQQELRLPPSAAVRSLARAIEARLSEPVPELLGGAPAPPHPRAPAAGHVPRKLPRGTVTFLMIDVEGSTAVCQRRTEAVKTTLMRHHALLRQELQWHGGHEVTETGDGFLVAFASAADALACAAASQRALHADPDGGTPRRVRMALHTGDVELEKGEYRGLVLPHVSRLAEAGHGGQVLCSEVTAVLLRRDALWGVETGLQLVDLGVYRLSDLSSSERLFQVNYPDMPQREFPPLNAATGYASSLPLQLTRFFGREAEIDRLVEMLRPVPSTDPERPAGHHRFVTLTGPGGSGKTRLALAAADRLLEPFLGAVWFVPLAALATPERILDVVRDILRLPRSPEVEPLEQVVATLSRRPTLLLLDNFEHLVAAGAPVVRTLLERIPDLTCLVTSRRRLNLAGEREFPVPPLETPGVQAFKRSGVGVDQPERLNSLLQFPSVQLFADRAQAVRPDFLITPSNAAAVAEICRWLEGIPLALELAAARASVLTPAQILAHLEDRLGFLVSRRHDVEERHRTLRAALDWSYRLLSPELQRFFARLSVFRGGFILAAAEAVGVGGDAALPGPALDYLEQLRECSLVEVTESEGEARYHLLETLREYGWQRLAEIGEIRTARTRHRDWFLKLAERAEAELADTPSRHWLDRLEREHENLRAALQWSVEEGTFSSGRLEVELALRLAGALAVFWRLRGFWTEGRERLSELLALSEASGTSAARAKALRGAAQLTNQQYGAPAARSLYEESVRMWRELGDQQALAHSLTDLVVMVIGEERLTEARLLQEESLEIQRGLDDKLGMAVSLRNLAWISQRQDDLQRARALCEEGVALAREAGHRARTAALLRFLAGIVRGQGDLALAAALAEESLTLAREGGDQHGTISVLHLLAHYAREHGDGGRAAVLLEEALALGREIDDKQGTLHTLQSLGYLTRDRGDLDAARSWFEQMLGIARELDEKKWGLPAALIGLGDVLRLQGERTAARSLFEESLAISKEIDDTPAIGWAYLNLGTLARERGDYEAARSLFEKSLAAHREARLKAGIAHALQGLGRVAWCQRDYAAAASFLEESLAKWRKMPNLREVNGTFLLLAEVALDQGDDERAVAWYRECLALCRETGNKQDAAPCLERLAGLASARGQPERAARLFGSAEALRAAIHWPLPPAEHPDYAAVPTIRAALGEEAFATAWADGRAMTAEQAIELGLNTSPGETTQRSARHSLARAGRILLE